MSGRQIWRKIRRVWITAGLIATAIFLIWSLIAYRANDEARQALRSDERVQVRQDHAIWRFAPVSVTPANVAFIFIPGSLVDPIAYAPLVHQTAAAGFPSYIVELPRRGAFGGAKDPEFASRVQALVAEKDQTVRWVVGGHSLGAVAACDIANQGFTQLSGLILIGTSHPRDVDLSDLRLPVTKIFATRDGLASLAEVEQNKSRLPQSTEWVRIEGGNHSHFGWYGFQPGDRFADLRPDEQRKQMTSAVLRSLRRIAETRLDGTTDTGVQ